MEVKYSYLPRQFAEIDDLLKDIKKFVKTGDFTLGKPLDQFEKRFAKLMGSKYAIGVNSGTDAIKLSLKAFDIGRGDEVITAANTFVATVGAIIELGAKPVFVDCDDTFCMNVDLIEEKISYKTPLDNRPIDNYSISFKSGSIHNNKLYVTTLTEILIFDLPEYKLVDRISLNIFNDLHHVIYHEENLLIVITGLDLVVKFSLNEKKIKTTLTKNKVWTLGYQKLKIKTKS